MCSEPSAGVDAMEYSRALLDLRQEALGEQVYSKGVASLEHQHHGTTVAEWMMRFVAHKPTAA